MSYYRTSKRPKADKRSVYITTAIVAALVIIILALYFCTDIFRAKTRTFTANAEMTVEMAVKNADSIVEVTVGETVETLVDTAAAPSVSKEGDTVDFVVYEKIELTTSGIYVGTPSAHVYTLGGKYNGYTHVYEGAASISKGERVILLLDSEGFLTDRSAGVFRITSTSAVNSADPSLSIPLSDFANWVESIRNSSEVNPSPSVVPSTTPSQEPTSTPTPEQPSASPSPTPTTVTNSVEDMSSDDAIRNCYEIVRGKVQSIGAVKTYVVEGQTHHYTEVSVKVTGAIHADPSLEGTVIRVKQLGGTVGHITYVYTGEASLKLNSDVILMLSPTNNIVGGVAGHYVVTNGLVINSKTGVSQDMNAFLMGVSRVLES